MQTVALTGGPVEILGALDFDRTADGIAPRRLPNWSRPQLPDPFIAMMVTLPSGVRLRFRTDSPVVELDVLTTALELDPAAPIAPRFDLTVVGKPHRVEGSCASEDGNVVAVDLTTDPIGLDFRLGTPSTLRFEGLDEALTDYELWLPPAAGVELRALRVSDAARVEPVVRTSPRWVHYGSSISHCMEAASPTGVWPVVAARGVGVDVINLGLAGQCHLDQFVARTIGDLAPDVVSLKLGINVVNADSMKERVFVSAVHGFLDTLRERLADTPVLVVSPIHCPVAEAHPGPTRLDATTRTVSVFDAPAALREGSLTLERVRAILTDVVAGRVERGDAHLSYWSGLELFGPGDLADLPDGLHPNAAGYRRIGERFADHAFGAGGPFARFAG
jgi:GDSL-like Lipase/Acylhydrolase family